MNWIVLSIGFASGAVVALSMCGIWYRHNKKRLAKVLTFFDVQARLDEVLAMTELDEKLIESLKNIRAKVDLII
jgi:hypothetical protein